MTHATQPKGGTEKSVLLFFAFHRQTPRPQRPQGAAAPYNICRRQPSFLLLCSPFIPQQYPLYTVTASSEALCPSGPAFSVAKVLPRKHTQVPLRYLNIIFRQLSRFPIVHISRTLNTATVKFSPNSLFVVSF